MMIGSAQPAGGARVEMMGTTLRVLTHELRTPINHIIGYSEMLLEDLAGALDADAARALEAVHAIGQDLLALVNARLGPAASPDALVSPEILADVRSAVHRSIDRILVEHLETSGLAQSHASAGDVTKILNATARLAEFARAGTIRTSE